MMMMSPTGSLLGLPPRFETLRLIIIRGGLKDITPNQVLGDVITQETYRVERQGVDQDEKKDYHKKKKTIAFKASSSSKSKGKAKKEESSDDEEASDFDMESMALFVNNFGKFMKNKGYHYCRLIYHCSHFHCHSDRNDGVILPPSDGMITRPLGNETGSSNFYH